ncbi:hypothetical protein JTE90_027924 [Oedothorax gibbosus]|uniref:Uncharacterized protein n=1 Tax=Oedothorax gibbosus TaxID=931172 RepID=A0AAV6VEE7_9ARAC|nr:hypothetical protein JTE90_027924 [Oedothorax gibbosus]
MIEHRSKSDSQNRIVAEEDTGTSKNKKKEHKNLESSMFSIRARTLHHKGASPMGTSTLPPLEDDESKSTEVKVFWT